MIELDFLVIGAGVIGLAIGRKLARSGRQGLIIERESSFGTGISSRNSEVIHAGIYYPQNSLRAALCVRGREQLYAYCQSRQIPHRKTGKLIVATSSTQLEKLRGILQQGLRNGVPGLRWLEADDARSLEPALRAQAAVLSPETGIVDSHAFMNSLLGEVQAAGSDVVFRTPFVAARPVPGGFLVQVGGIDPEQIRCRCLVNAGGLDAWNVAAAIEGFGAMPARHLAKGNYYALSGARAPFAHLIYPVPEDGGLGVHLTLDLAGQARFGPDVEWLVHGDFDFTVDPFRAAGFYDRIRDYWPGLPDGTLVPAYCGVRPKLSGPGEPAADFLLQDHLAHGLPGLVNLFGIESPGLTSALAIGEAVLVILDSA